MRGLRLEAWGLTSLWTKDVMNAAVITDKEVVARTVMSSNSLGGSALHNE